MTELTLKINGEDVTADVEPRLSLADFVRDHRRLTGTHLGCEHGVCGACTVLMNGEPCPFLYHPRRCRRRYRDHDDRRFRRR